MGKGVTIIIVVWISCGKADISDNEKLSARDTGRGSKTKTGLRQKEGRTKGKKRPLTSLDTQLTLVCICGLRGVSPSISTTCASSDVCSVLTRERNNFYSYEINAYSVPEG